MAAATRAVFLSYASQDAEAARRICESLRAGDIEVWFDQNELVGGDAWDAKIRGQINSCALFVPVISAATQARREGYFRLEWKLAAQRTHMISERTAFLLPVVIDATRDAEADVPGEFRAVQWTRLPNGETPAAFCARVKQLLGGEVTSVVAGVADPGPASARPATTKPRRSPFALTAGAFAIVVAIGTALFIAKKSERPVMTPAQPAAPTPSSALQAAAPVVSDKSIAVLPFANRSPDKANEFFTDGVQDDIITNLFNIRELRVVSRTSVEQYRGTTKTMKQIGTELGVAFLLEGSVQRVGDKVHVTGQLIDARTDAHLWAKSFDKDLSDIFVIQAELAKAIAVELKAVLSPEEQKLIEQKLTDNPKAYDLYLEAGAEFRRVGNLRAAHERSITLNQAAVELDPKFAAAWESLSFSHGYFYNSNWDHSPARLAKAKEALEKVEQLVHGSPLAISNLARFYYNTGDYPRALEQYESLALLAPNNGGWQNQIAICNRRLSRWPQALAAAHKAVELDPESVVLSNVLVQTAAAGRRFGEAESEARRWLRAHPDAGGRISTLARLIFHESGAIQEAEKILATMPDAYCNSLAGLERRKIWAFATGALDEYLRLETLKPADAPANWSADQARGIEAALVRMARGDAAGAKAKLADISELRARTAAEPENSEVWGRLGQYEALLGNKEEALRCARKAVELTPESRDALRGPSRRQALAFVYAWTGDRDRAIAEYTHLLRVPCSPYLVSDSNDSSGLNVHEMKHSPEFFPLRGDPRFEALLNDPKNNAPLF